MDYSHPNQNGDRSPKMYDLSDPLPAAPALPGAVVVAATADELIDKLAADLVIHAINCVRQFGDFHLALSGGSTPEPLYERLMYDPNYRRLPWRRTHLWIVDERCVPFEDEQSNYRMIHETIVDHADIPPDQVHPIPVGSDTPDVEYEKELREALGWRERGQDRLDYVLLGMGTDGHTASLFPATEPLSEANRLVRLNFTDSAEPHERVTLTFPTINASRFIAVLITGEKKASVIERLATGNASVDDLPIKGVQPINGELRWYLDSAACGK